MSEAAGTLALQGSSAGASEVETPATTGTFLARSRPP
jgi:hypothetical protein